MNTVKLSSFAKINLSLDVSTLRPDGYHEIDSVVQVIDIADQLELTVGEPGVIEVAVEQGDAPSGPDNLVYRACEEFFDAAGVDGGVSVRLWKSIPTQAGLGGGSGNAAAAVVGLNKLFGCRLHTDELAKIASRVGSDAALFVYGGTVHMTGRGEFVRGLVDAPALHLVVVKPDVGVSTKWAYALLDRSRDRVREKCTPSVLEAVLAANRSGLVESIGNDFDAVISESSLAIRDAKKKMMNLGAEAALLCGSGSAVFGVFADAIAADKAGEKLSEGYNKVFTCRTLNRDESHPGAMF